MICAEFAAMRLTHAGNSKPGLSQHCIKLTCTFAALGNALSARNGIRNQLGDRFVWFPM
jgi:hypothetical protein